jgi:ERF superfamily
MSDTHDVGMQDLEIPAEIAKVIIKVQRKLQPLVRTSSNEEYDSKFTPLPQVMTFALELLNKNKVGVIQSPTTIDGLAALRTILVHESGVSFQDATKLALPKVDPQSHASAITYMRRYALMSMLGLTSEDDDDDGNKASGVFQKPTDEQIEQIKSLCLAMNYSSKDIAAQVWKVKTRDHATLTILNLNKMISQRAGDIEAADRALKIEHGVPGGEHITVITDDEINQDPDSKSLEYRLDNLGLAGKGMVNKFIFSITGKPFLTKCTPSERALLTTALNAVESGTHELPDEWYPNNKQPAPREPTA